MANNKTNLILHHFGEKRKDYFMIDQVLNSKQAKRLFEENSVYIDGADIVTVNRAQELFERDAVDYAEQNGANQINSKGVKGFDFLGFTDMVTFHNVKMISSGRVTY